MFDKIFHRFVVFWTVMIFGYGIHGNACHFLDNFNEIQWVGMKPYHVTFTLVLLTCCHGVVVDEGLMYFNSLIMDYDITPIVEHYSCMVYVLGHVGHIDEAVEFIKSIPLNPNTCILELCLVLVEFIAMWS